MPVSRLFAAAARVCVACACLVLAACGPHNPNNGAAEPTTMIKNERGAESSGGDETSAASAPSETGTEGGCGVRQAPRTFVGFAERQTLDDFSRTAAEAERLLAAIKPELCALDAKQDHDGTLRAALSGGLLEITAVRFTHKTLASANVDVQTVAPDGSSSGAEIHWLVRMKQGPRGWQIASSARR